MPRLFEEGPPSIETAMLIRRPASDVFEAFIEPALTTKFWFTASTGRLESGKQVEWLWEMFGASANVTGIAVEPPARILYEWGAAGSRTKVEFRFSERPEESTFVAVSVAGFSGNDGEIVRQMVDAMGGFSLVLAGAKAFLEHGMQLNLVADRYPDRRT